MDDWGNIVDDLAKGALILVAIIALIAAVIGTGIGWLIWG